jgi:flagellar motor switch protein FliG
VAKPSTIAGPQRVAAFLLSLEPEAAAPILKSLKEDVLAEVARAMVELDPRLSEPGAVERLYRDVALSLHGQKLVRSCDAGELGRILATSLGKAKGDAVLAEIQVRRLKERPFLALEEHAVHRIARVLQEESPAVAALVLAHLAPMQSAEILQLFEKEAATAVVKRMATLVPPGEPVLRTIAADLSERLESLAKKGDEQGPLDRLRSIASLLNSSAPELEKDVIEAIAADDSDMAGQLRDFMFTWEDIASVNKRAMQKILGTVDTKTLSIALKACTAEVEANILGSLSTRVRDMVNEERELAGPQPMPEVQNARGEIMNGIRALIESGEFRPSRGGENLVT